MRKISKLSALALTALTTFSLTSCNKSSVKLEETMVEMQYGFSGIVPFSVLWDKM